jgi:hypothetical protein
MVEITRPVSTGVSVAEVWVVMKRFWMQEQAVMLSTRYRKLLRRVHALHRHLPHDHRDRSQLKHQAKEAGHSSGISDGTPLVEASEGLKTNPATCEVMWLSSRTQPAAGFSDESASTCEGSRSEGVDEWFDGELGGDDDTEMLALVTALEHAAAAVLPEGVGALPTLEGGLAGDITGWAGAVVRLVRSRAGELGAKPLSKGMLSAATSVSSQDLARGLQTSPEHVVCSASAAYGEPSEIGQGCVGGSGHCPLKEPGLRPTEASSPVAKVLHPRELVDVAVGRDEAGDDHVGGVDTVVPRSVPHAHRKVTVSYASTFAFVDEAPQAPQDVQGAARHVRRAETSENPPISGGHRRNREVRRATVAEVERSSRSPARREEWALSPTNACCDPEKHDVVDHAAYCPALPWRVLAPVDVLPVELARRAAVVRATTEGSGILLPPPPPLPPSPPTRIHGFLEAETPAAALRGQWLKELGDDENTATFQRMARELQQLNCVYGQVLEKAAKLQTARGQGWLAADASNALRKKTSTGALETLQAMDVMNGFEPIGVAVARAVRRAAERSKDSQECEETHRCACPLLQLSTTLSPATAPENPKFQLTSRGSEVL